MTKPRKDIVTEINDGDTITASRKKKTFSIRIACIDAPELAQAPYGSIAKDAVTGLIPVGSKILFSKKSTDLYGRTVAEVFNSRRKNVGAELVRNGYAFVYSEYADQCNKDQLISQENAAAGSKLGIWADTTLQRPWDFRQQNSSSVSPQPAAATSPSTPESIPAFQGSRVITCSQITSKDEATRWLLAGHSYLDADSDGCACESQFPC